MIASCLAFLVVECVSLKIECEFKERKEFIDPGYFLNGDPNAHFAFYDCNLNENTKISSLDAKFDGEKNENVTDIAGNDIKGLEYFPIDIVDSFPNVKSINVFRTSLKEISSKNFHGLNKVESLNLIANQISSIDENAFDDFAVIYRIQLNRNKLTSIPAKLFSKLSTLDTLHLEDNEITALDGDIFKNNHKLAILHLSSNKLTSFVPGTFDSLVKMRQIGFYNNQITSVDSKLFKNCISLVDLSAIENNITEIPINFLATLTSLSSVSFSKNPISVIDFKMFENNKNIYDISFNDIKVEKVLNIDVVDKLSALRGIHFKINSESCIIGNYHEGNLDKLKKEIRDNCKTE